MHTGQLEGNYQNSTVCVNYSPLCFGLFFSQNGSELKGGLWCLAPLTEATLIYE